MGLQHAQGRGGGRTAEKVGLAAGFVALAVAAYLARTSVARGYEVSIYQSTPGGFWVGGAVAMVVALLVALSTTDRAHRLLALVLGGATTLAVAALPLIRGYAYYGTSDALTHLGWARDVQAGQLALPDLYYPAVHTLGLLVESLSGQAITRTLLVGVLVVVAVYLLFVPLAVGALTDDPRGVAVGAFAAFFLLPINHVSVHYMSPHPISQAILFSPLVVYLLAVYLDEDSGLAVSALLALALAATVPFHSMLAAALLVMLGAIALVQLFYRRRVAGGRALAGRPVYGHAAFLLVVFVLWNVRFPVVERTAELMLLSVEATLFGGSVPAEAVGRQGTSLAAIGAGLHEIVLKLFFPSIVVGLLAAWVVLHDGRRWRDERFVRTRLLGIGVLAVGLYSLPFFVGDVSELFFRYFGFVMALCTVLGAVAIVRLAAPGGDAWRRWSVPTRSVLAVGAAVLLVTSMFVLFPSPYVYLANEQVSEGELAGYETAFEYQDPDVAFAGVRSGPQRYVQAVYGRQGVPEQYDRFGFYRAEGAVPPEAMGSLPGHFEGDRYLLVTEHDRQRETVAYRGLRYSDDHFARVEGQPGVGRVMSNGEVDAYYVESDADA